MSVETESTAHVEESTANVEPVEPVEQSTPETPAPQEPSVPASDDWRHNPEVYNTIAAVKKEARQKAYEDGYEAARRDLPNQNQGQQQQSTYNTPSHSAPNQQIPSEFRAVEQKAVDVGFSGAAKFDDWDSRVGRLQNVASRNPQVFQIVAAALDLPIGVSEGVVYELSKNPEKLEELKKVHPAYLAGELIKLAQPSASQSKVAVKKIAPPPIEDIKTPPASGGSELTYDQMRERHKQSRNKYRR